MITLGRKADKFDPARVWGGGLNLHHHSQFQDRCLTQGRRTQPLLQDVEAEYRPGPVESKRRSVMIVSKAVAPILVSRQLRSGDASIPDRMIS